MMTIETMTEFFGWCTIINMGLLTFSSILIMSIRKTAIRMHGKMFNLGEKELSVTYFQYLGQFKVATIVFSLVPYIALKIMG